MRFFRVGLPALTGVVVLFAAAQSIRVGLGDGGAAATDLAHAWLLPIAFAAGVLLIAVAISSRARAGYVLGLGLAGLMVLGGLAVIALEVPYLAEGGLGAALGAGVVILASVWILAWAIDGISIRGARATFAADWQPIDRHFGIVLGSLAIFATTAYLFLGLALSDAAAAVETGHADAQALVAGTTVEARVLTASYTQPADGGAARLERLTLELSFTSSQDYALARVPTVCLADAVTSRDPAFKPDAYCWGSPGPALELADGFADLSMPTAARVIHLELQRGDSLCAFGPGEWDALLQLAPRVGEAPGAVPPEAYARTATFMVPPPVTSVPPPPSGTIPSGDCLASTVSP